MRTSRRNLSLALSAAALTALAFAIPPVRRLFHPLILKARGPRTIQDRLNEFAAARARVQSHCHRANLPFPPSRIVILAFKHERQLQIYAGPNDQSLKRIATYPILAASGTLGPKLQEGDRQVPEGVYPLESLNPNSRFHVALRIGYPNDFDKQMAQRDARTQLGGDIMIHGGQSSIGCLAIGDPAAEDLFVLAANTGIQNATILLCPLDLRTHPPPSNLNTGWRPELYTTLRARLIALGG
jgi:hypothetical protein